MTTFGWRCVWLAAGLLVGPVIALADDAPPRVDCAKAVTVIDKMICGDPKLAEADHKLSREGSQPAATIVIGFGAHHQFGQLFEYSVASCCRLKADRDGAVGIQSK